MTTATAPSASPAAPSSAPSGGASAPASVPQSQASGASTGGNGFLHAALAKIGIGGKVESSAPAATPQTNAPDQPAAAPGADTQPQPVQDDTPPELGAEDIEYFANIAKAALIPQATPAAQPAATPAAAAQAGNAAPTAKPDAKADAKAAAPQTPAFVPMDAKQFLTDFGVEADEPAGKALASLVSQHNAMGQRFAQAEALFGEVAEFAKAMEPIAQMAGELRASQARQAQWAFDVAVDGAIGNSAFLARKLGKVGQVQGEQAAERQKVMHAVQQALAMDRAAGQNTDANTVIARTVRMLYGKQLDKVASQQQVVPPGKAPERASGNAQDRFRQLALGKAAQLGLKV